MLGSKMEEYTTRAEALKGVGPAEEEPAAQTEPAAATEPAAQDESKLREELSRMLIVEEPRVYGSPGPDVAGLTSAKQSLREVLLHRTAPMRGVLLYGPPGTGKTLFASASGMESQLTRLILGPSRGYPPPELFSMLFEEARRRSPADDLP